MRRVILLIIISAVLGCRKQPSIVGEWSIRAGSGNGTMIFRDDRSFRSMTESALATLILDGTYTMEGASLRLHVATWSVEKSQPMSDHDRETMNSALRSDAISRLSWIEDRHFKLSSANGELTTAERVSK